MKRRPSSLLPGVFFGMSALVLASPFACSSQSASSGASAAGKEKAVRSTEIVHESCDIEDKAAVKTDVNGDNRPDIVRVMSGGRELCRAVDLNFDGKFDTFVYQDESGKERRRESDFDRDGVLDEVETLQNGVVVLKERETNLDGKLDTWDTYVGGKLSKRERDTTGDGQVDQWWEFPNADRPECPIIAADQDGDGRPDARQDICKENEASGIKPATSAPTAAPAVATTPPSASSAPATPPPASPSSSAAPKSTGGAP